MVSIYSEHLHTKFQINILIGCRDIANNVFLCQVGAFDKFWQNLTSSLHIINIKNLFEIKFEIKSDQLFF